MKTSRKILMPFVALATVTPTLTCVACGNQNPNIPDAETVGEYIIKPTKLDPQKYEKDWEEFVATWTDQEIIEEIYYDLFGFFNIPDLQEFDMGGKSLAQLYQENIVGIKTNIGSCTFEKNMERGGIKLKFIGYVSFVFLKDYQPDDKIDVLFKKDDYVMITYDMDQASIRPLSEALAFKIDFCKEPLFGQCLGFYKIKKKDNGYLLPIGPFDTLDYVQRGLPENHGNFVKSN